MSYDPNDPAHRESGNASRYTLHRLPYSPIAEGQDFLGLEIQIETAVWPLRLPAIGRPLISFMAEAFTLPPEVPAISCVSPCEPSSVWRMIPALPAGTRHSDGTWCTATVQTSKRPSPQSQHWLTNWSERLSSRLFGTATRTASPEASRSCRSCTSRRAFLLSERVRQSGEPGPTKRQWTRSAKDYSRLKSCPTLLQQTRRAERRSSQYPISKGRSQ